jgi:hypothetical protein
MDMSTTIVPKSDQLNADDLMSGPRTVTIIGVSKGSVEQPVNFDLAEFPGRAYRPGKSMRRVMVHVWGPEASDYVGRRLTLYREADIKFGPDVVGGIRISHMSHIDRRLTLALTVTRGKRAPFVVEPLPNEPDVTEFQRRIAEASTVAELDAVAADLKGCDLGSHRKRLQGLWTDRRKSIETIETDAPVDRSDEVAELWASEADSEA